ncbi:MAG: transposase, partial [Bacteroidota bacterium]
VERQSGSTINGKTRISKKGNRHIRRALHFPALSVVKYHEEFTNLYNRVYDRTKIKMKGYVAVQRKLLVLIYTLYKKNEAYDPTYTQKQRADQGGRQGTMPAYTG